MEVPVCLHDKGSAGDLKVTRCSKIKQELRNCFNVFLIKKISSLELVHPWNNRYLEFANTETNTKIVLIS